MFTLNKRTYKEINVSISNTKQDNAENNVKYFARAVWSGKRNGEKVEQIVNNDSVIIETINTAIIKVNNPAKKACQIIPEDIEKNLTIIEIYMN